MITTHTGTIYKGDPNCCTDYGVCPACKAARKAFNDSEVAALDAANGGPRDVSVPLLPGPHFFSREPS